jgi:hypothetical protein
VGKSSNFLAPVCPPRRSPPCARLTAGFDLSWHPFVSRHCRHKGSRVGVGGSGKWLVRRADVRGQVGHAGLQSRPRLPSRACCLTPYLVLEHTGEHDVRQAPFEGRMAIIDGIPPAFLPS